MHSQQFGRIRICIRSRFNSCDRAFRRSMGSSADCCHRCILTQHDLWLFWPAGLDLPQPVLVIVGQGRSCGSDCEASFYTHSFDVARRQYHACKSLGCMRCPMNHRQSGRLWSSRRRIPSLERSAHETVVMTISAVCSVVWSNVIADQHAGLAAQPQAENHLRPYSSCSESPKALPAVHVNFIKP